MVDRPARAPLASRPHRMAVARSTDCARGRWPGRCDPTGPDPGIRGTDARPCRRGARAMMRRYAGRRSPIVAAKPDLPQREEITVEIPAGPVVVELRRATRARRMTLRVPPGGAAPIVTVPVRAPIGSAERFVRGQAEWLAARLAERTPVVPFVAGATIPLRGETHEIRGTGRVRGTVSVEETADGRLLWVPGAPEHVGRRLTTWLKAEARTDLEAAVATYAAQGRQATVDAEGEGHAGAVGLVQPFGCPVVLVASGDGAAVRAAVRRCTRGGPPRRAEPFRRVLAPQRRARPQPRGRPCLVEAQRPHAARHRRRLIPPHDVGERAAAGSSARPEPRAAHRASMARTGA